jgi:hypothetical protein
MTATVERSVQISVFSTIGGIGAAASLLWMAAHGGIEFGVSLKTAKAIAGIVTAGGLPAAVLSWLFEKYGWRYAVFQGWLVKVPDLSGIWEGPSISNYFKDSETGRPQRVDLTATIDHRFDEIIYTQKALTESVVLAADLTVHSKNRCELIVCYENYEQEVDLKQIKVDPKYAENSRSHKGTHILTLSRPAGEKKASTKWTLAGPYWTDKERTKGSSDKGTTGKVNLTWKSSLPKTKLWG